MAGRTLNNPYLHGERDRRVAERLAKCPRRQDAVDAIVAFGALYHGGGGSKIYGHMSRLYRFARTAVQLEGHRALTPQGRAMYKRLVKEWGDDFSRNRTRYANF